MRKSILSALIGSAFALGTAHAGLTLDLNGAAGGGVIVADALDWAPTSFLAMGGNTAIGAFASGACATAPLACQFDVLTHAKLTAYKPSGSGAFTGLPAFGGEITMVARYTEQVIGFTPGAFPTAQFLSTGAGWVEFYYSAAADSDDLSGGNYNNGRLIGRLDGVTAGAFGNFTVTQAPNPASGVFINIDQTNFGADDDYAGQQTVLGTGSQTNLSAGLSGMDLDPSFFLTALADFKLIYQDIKIGLPFNSNEPSDCFTDTARAVGSVGSSFGSTCDTNHDNAQYAGQVNATGYTPNIGAVNGLNLGNPDFLATSDYSSSVNGTPEPGSIALVGLALGALGLAGRRRRA